MQAYGLLLRLYPKSFRLEYETELRSDFRIRRRQAGTGLAVLAFWLGLVTDTLRSAASVHVDLLGQDVGYALRGWRRARGFVATAILVTAIGVGANTAVFSITDRVLIRPLPYPDSGRLVKIWENLPQYSRMEPSPANYRDWRERTKSFESMGAYHTTALNLVGEGEPRRLEAAALTSEVLPMLGVAPARGRVFTAEDDTEGAPGTVILSDPLWRSQFGADSRVLGRRLRLNDESYEVLGVMPPGFSFPDRETQLWIPERFAPAAFEDRDDNFLKVIAKLRPGVGIDDARAEMRVVTEQLEREYPDADAETRATVWLLRDEVSRQARTILAALFGAALCVLLLACANLAGLLLARALARRRELSVRAALGAGRERLVRQLLTESLLLSGAGGLLGVLIAMAAAPLLASLVPTTLPLDGAAPLDGRVLIFALGLTLATGIGFGLVPAWRAGRGAGVAGLHDKTRGGLGARRERLRRGLVVTEVAAAVALVVSSGLLIRALWRVQATDPGFRSAGVITLRTAPPLPKYVETERRARLYERIVSEVEALPGVRRAAYISFLPLRMRGGVWPVTLEGRPPDPQHEERASLRYVTPGFFDALDIPLRRGRDVEREDGPDAPYVAVVSRSFAEQHWPGQDPIGRSFEMAFAKRQVVGVVGDIAVRGLEWPSEPQVYVPYRQVPDGAVPFYAPKDLVVRAAVDPASLVPAIRRIVHQADPELPLSDVQALGRIVEAETASRRAQLWVLGAFAGVALLLAGLGIHGLLSYVVSEREAEIGVRVALGAGPRRVLGLVLGDALQMALWGGALGLVLAHLGGRAMQALLFGISPADPATFTMGLALAVLLCVSGSLASAVRALRMDPVAALRAEG